MHQMHQIKIWIQIRIRVISRIQIRINVMRIHNTGTYEQCCGSGMFIPKIMIFFPSRIPDPTTTTKEEGGKTPGTGTVVDLLFCSHKFHKI